MTAPKIEYLTRAQWGAKPYITTKLRRNTDRLHGITFHHTTGTNAGHVDTGQWARNIQQFCFARGYGDIEYNAMIRAYRDPTTHEARAVFVEGRDDWWVGAHATSFANTANRLTSGVALMGNADEVLSDAALHEAVVALMNLCWYLQLLYANEHDITDSKAVGHREWRPFGGIATYCPGPKMLDMVHALNG